MKCSLVALIFGAALVHGSASASQPFAVLTSLAQSGAVTLSDPEMPPGGASDVRSTSFRYKISGDPSLRPARISDDGTHMYLEWAEDQALPAVFAVNAQAEEEMVDGYMRQGIFTIDRIHNRLVFRIDKKRARAERTKR